MRNELNTVLKEFLQSRLKEVKTETKFTQEFMAGILQMDRRTLSGVMRGEYAFGGLSVALFFVFLTKESGQEIDVLRAKFFDVLGEDWKKRYEEAMKDK